MVYFKLTKSLLQIIEDSQLEGLVGCQKYCDRQYVSFTDIDKVLQKLIKDYEDAVKQVEKILDHERKTKEFAMEGADSDLKK